MSTPNTIYDGGPGGGTVTAVTQDGPGWFTKPFEARGDTQSWEYHAYFTCLAANYIPVVNTVAFIPVFPNKIELMQTLVTSKGIGYLVNEEDATEVSCSLMRFKRTYASQPVTRYEGTTLTYSRQFLSTFAEYTWTNPPPLPEVNEWAVPLKGWYKFEYFISEVPDIVYAPRVNTIFNTILYIPFQSATPGDGGWPPTYTAPFVAQDSEINIYKASIIERKTLYAVWPTTVT